jgi:hypothetical protein
MPLTAVLLTIGVGTALANIRTIRPFILIAWVLLTFVLGGVLTYDPPFWPHMIIALPAIMLLAAYGADTILNALADSVAIQARQIGYWMLASAIAATGTWSNACNAQSQTIMLLCHCRSSRRVGQAHRASAYAERIAFGKSCPCDLYSLMNLVEQ